ncbi:ABC transporter permease [Companilactobacillus versmoldensis]|uniref:ABC transporter permease n=1 Tax=Companilactobacillus versmoldensis TaxID=194326 RepID=UPI000249159A|nr:FtsX-like permease family protein [Companilactobacillus versmoldensis]
MYLKIIKRSLYNLRDSYLIYILSSSFAVAVLTIFSTLINDPTLRSVHYWNQTFQSFMYFMIFIFGFFTFIYMTYVGGFFIQQQKNEFRTYKKLGMSRWIIAVIGFLKTFIVQIIAWLLGMLVAIILQKFVGMMLVYLMHVKLNFGFFLDPMVIWRMLKLGIYSTFLLSLINGVRSYWIVRRQKDSHKLHLNLFFRSIFGIIGLLMFIGGILASLQVFQSVSDTQNIDLALWRVLWIVPLYFIGTYLVIMGFVPLCLYLFDHIKLFSYHGINLVSYKYLRKRLLRNTTIIWFITEMSALALAILVFCYAGYQVVYQNFSGAYPFEVSAISDPAKKIKAEFAKEKTDVTHEYRSKIKRTVSYTFDSSSNQYEPKLISLMSYSDYHALPKRIQNKNPHIGPDDFLELKNDYQSLTPGYRSTKHAVQVKGTKSIKNRSVGSFFPYGYMMFSGYLFVVPDNYYHNVQSESTETYYGWDIKHSDKLSNKFLKKLNQKNKNPYVITVHIGSTLNKSYLYEKDDQKQNHYRPNEYYQNGYVRQADAKHIIDQTSGFFLFLVSIFSIALLIALGSLLTLKVLLRDDNEWHQLKTLKKIGMTERELKQIVRRETGLLFGLPIVFALVQSSLSVGILNLSVNQSAFKPFTVIGSAFIVLYGLTGWLTYILSWRGVKQRI